MIKKIIFFCVLLILAKLKSNAQYCSGDTRFTEKQFFDSTEITIASNVQYGSALDYQGNNYALRMDLYYPNINIDTLNKRPFILLFHGGGFISGDKQSGDIKDLCVYLSLRGFVCASVNYRLGYEFSEYGQYKARYRAIQDGHAAMRYLINSANTIKIDTNWMFVGGQSAGALLALGMVYADVDELDSVSLLYNTTNITNELGNLYTSGNNLTNTYSFRGIFNNWGAAVKSEIDKEEMLPTISFHGSLDTVVLINTDHSFLHYKLDGSEALYSNLITNNICSEITIDTLGGHGIFRNKSSEFRAQRASCFFKSIFCNTCNSIKTIDSIPSTCSINSSIFNSSDPTIKLHPNPITNYINIDGINDPYTFIIYNTIGQVVYSEKKNKMDNYINLMDVYMPSGIYYIYISNTETNKTYQIKLIKSIN